MVWLKRISLALAGILIAIVLAAYLKPLPGDALTPAGAARNSALYLAAEDGTRIAIDVWLPADLAAGARIPTLIEGSRYWRDVGITLGGRILHLFGLNAPGMLPGDSAAFFNRHGYAYITVEVRGTGASFGVHDSVYSLQEIADYAAVLDWIVEQPWSNGRAGAVGVSYAGTTAELMTTIGHPALQAVAPLYSDFDTQYHLATPGGIYQPAFVEAWSDMVLAMDRNDTCTVVGAESITACLLTRFFVAGIKPVDGPDGRLLAEAVAEHDSQDPSAMVDELQYRDSPWGRVEYSSLDNQAYARKDEIEASAVPMFVMSGWFDAATVEGSLARYESFSNVQSVTIAPFSHGGEHDTDPFRATDASPVLSSAEQLARLETFFAAYLKDLGEPPARGISYYVMGGERWRNTDSWPPSGFERKALFLTPDGGLSPSALAAPATTSYQVDFETGTEPRSRWMTQLGGGDVVYDDRAAATSRLLSFNSEPFDVAMELTGTVTVDLWLTADQPDGALHGYLEAVAPDGTSHYLSEGVLRLKHRKVASEPPLYPHFGPYHSFLKRDAADMPIGQPEPVALGLYATSAYIGEGYRLRLSLAGADATSFARIPAEGSAPNWLVHHGGAEASRISVPLRPWN